MVQVCASCVAAFVWWSHGKSLAFSVVWWSYGKSLAFSVVWWCRGESLAFSVLWWSFPVVAGGPVVPQAVFRCCRCALFPSWGLLRLVSGLLGPPGPYFRPPGAHFGPPAARFGPPRAHFEPPGTHFTPPGARLGVPGLILVLPGGLLGLSWGALGSLWGLLNRSPGPIRTAFPPSDSPHLGGKPPKDTSIAALGSGHPPNTQRSR